MGHSDTALAWIAAQVGADDILDFFRKAPDGTPLSPDAEYGPKYKEAVRERFDKLLVDKKVEERHQKGLGKVFENYVLSSRGRNKAVDTKPWEGLREFYQEHTSRVTPPPITGQERLERLEEAAATSRAREAKVALFREYRESLAAAASPEELKEGKYIERLRAMKGDKDRPLTTEQVNNLIEMYYEKRTALGLKPVSQKTFKADVGFIDDADLGVKKPSIDDSRANRVARQIQEREPWIGKQEADSLAREELRRADRIQAKGGPVTYFDALVSSYRRRNPGRFKDKDYLDLEDLERLSKADYRGNDALGYTARLSPSEHRIAKSYAQEMYKAQLADYNKFTSSLAIERPASIRPASAQQVFRGVLQSRSGELQTQTGIVRQQLQEEVKSNLGPGRRPAAVTRFLEDGEL